MTEAANRVSKPRKAAKGNTTKFDAYAAAFARITLAQKAGFYLEAVTVAESIISDRLLSYASRPGVKKAPPISEQFAKLIGAIKPVEAGLHDELEKWRKKRNKLIHGFAKSLPGKPLTPVEDTLAAAQEAASEGEHLARRVCEWHRKEKKKATSA